MSPKSPSARGGFRVPGLGELGLTALALVFGCATLIALGVEAAAIGADDALAPPLSVLVSRAGFTLYGADAALPDPAYAIIPCKERRCNAVQAYDYDGLTARLALVKDRWPQRESLAVLPTDAVPMEVVLRTVSAGTADRRASRRAEGDRILFPDVMVVRRLLSGWREIPPRP